LVATSEEGDGQLLVDPTPRKLANAQSAHVLVFSGQGKVLLIESEGAFSLDSWQDVLSKSREICMGTKAVDEAGERAEMDVEDVDGSQAGLHGFIRKSVVSRLSEQESWRPTR